MKPHLRGLGLVCVALCSALSTGPQAVAERAGQRGGTLQLVLATDGSLLDPQATNSEAALAVCDLLYEPLYRDTGAGPTPALAAALPQITNKTSVFIPLRRGLTFHDGTAVTPTMVAAYLDKTQRGPHGYLLRALGPIRATDEGIAFELAQPMPSLAAVLALPQTAIVARPGVGAGPFALLAREERNAPLTFVAFAHYHGGRPALDRIEVRWTNTSDGEARAFETGASHTSQRGPVAFLGSKPKYYAERVRSPVPSLAYVGVGQRAGMWQHPGFRRALDAALARNGLRTLGAASGDAQVVPAYLPVPAAANVAKPQASHSATAAQGSSVDRRSNGDLATGRAWLATLPLPLRQAAPTVPILIDRLTIDDREIAERIVHTLAQLGVAAEIEAVSSVDFSARVARGDCALFIGHMRWPGSLAALWWVNAFAGSAARQLDSPATLAAVFVRELPVIPLLHRYDAYWVRNDIGDIAFNAMGWPDYANLRWDGPPRLVRPTTAEAPQAAPLGLGQAPLAAPFAPAAHVTVEPPP